MGGKGRGALNSVARRSLCGHVEVLVLVEAREAWGEREASEEVEMSE
jgi:hypothetical protein